ncbi:MAG: hypothetical protein RR645_02035 [Clostridium sp.]
MGKVTRIIKIKNKISGVEYLKTIYNSVSQGDERLELNGTVVHKGLEIDSILVNVIEDYNEIKMEKLVSLKAFLLSKEEGMDVNNLIINIDKVMKITDNGLLQVRNGIKLNYELKIFLERASIRLDLKGGILNDTKREVRIKIEEDILDFNSIREIL